MQPTSSNSNVWWLGASRSVWLAALALGIMFFLSEHSIYTSLAQDFTQDADGMLETAEGGNTFRRIAFLSIAALGIGLLLYQRPKFGLSLLGVMILAMAGLCFISVLWAQDRGLCLRRLLVLGLALVGMFGVSSRFSLKEICQIGLLTSLGCVLIGIACEILLGTFRPWEGEYRFSGTVHPNTQGAYLATIGFAALSLGAMEVKRRPVYWSILIASLGLLILTKSRTSTAGVLAGMGVVVLAMSSARVRWLMPMVCLWLAASGLLVLLLSGADADALIAKVALMGREEDAESFSGRTTIWPVLQPYIEYRFWLGHGYESFWTPGVIDEVTTSCQWAVREAHSAYREMLLSLGFVGLSLYCATVLVGVGAAVLRYVQHRDATGLFWLGMAIYGFFNALFESGMVWISFPTFIIAAGLARLAYFEIAKPMELWQPVPRNSLALGTR